MLYSVVINNPTDADDAELAKAAAKGWIIHGQLERGENGTPHYQLAIESPASWAVMKRAFKRANIEEAKDPEALLKYVVKTETRTRLLDFTANTRPKKDASDKLSLGVFWNEVFHSLHATYGDLDTGRLAHTSGMDLLNAATRELVREHGFAFARFAVRPDIKATWRNFRTALYAHWCRENSNDGTDSVSTDSIQLDGDDTVPRQEDTDDEQTITLECADNQEASDEEDSEESEGDSSTEVSSAEDD